MRIELYRAIEGDAPIVSDFIDAHLRDDVYIPEKRIRDMITRPTSQCWLVLVDQQFAGVCFVRDGSEVYLMFLAPWARGQGVGKEVIRRLQPKTVRVNTLASAGDLSRFYATNGYRLKASDLKKPHVHLYERINP